MIPQGLGNTQMTYCFFSTRLGYQLFSMRSDGFQLLPLQGCGMSDELIAGAMDTSRRKRFFNAMNLGASYLKIQQMYVRKSNIFHHILQRTL